jgi:predicted nucleotidyltransferase component of viral defense system
MAIEQSILAKLKNKAIETKQPYQDVLRFFLQEEFLRRLSLSKYSDNFILKGGLFIYTLTNFESRVTVDVDFLMSKLSNEITNMQNVIDEIITVKTGNEYITFEHNKMRNIITELDYNGVSFQLVGVLGNTKTPFIIDIGVGDVVSPNYKKRAIPTQLDGFEMPIINTYSLESMIAEKLHAILFRLNTTSRMKDFYDIYYISKLSNFTGSVLQTAIQKTFINRNMKIDSGTMPSFISLRDDAMLISRWKSYLKTINAPNVDFSVIMEQIINFLEPVIINTTKNIKLELNWKSKENTWKDK